MNNGEGIRNSLFVSGCTHGCKGCFNEKAWDFRYGKKFDTEFMLKIIEDLKDKNVAGLSLLGGEPFQQPTLGAIVKGIKAVVNKPIWCWTGYTIEQLLEGTEAQKALLKQVDILVDGRFDESKKDLSLRFRGSTNQRIVDVKKTLEKGEIVLWQ